MEPQDTITLAPSVLITIARHAATQVDGVARTGMIPVDVIHVLRGHPMGSGVVLNVSGNQVAVDIYLVVKPGVNMRETSVAVQEAITRAIQELVGMEVTAVNTHIEDVEFPFSGDTKN